MKRVSFGVLLSMVVFACNGGSSGSAGSARNLDAGRDSDGGDAAPAGGSGGKDMDNDTDGGAGRASAGMGGSSTTGSAGSNQGAAGHAGEPGSTDEGNDAGMNADLCNEVQNTAPLVPATIVHTAPPSSPSGGALMSGTYYLTSHVGYAPPGCTLVLPSCALTMTIHATSPTAGTGELIQDCDPKPASVRFSFQYALDGDKYKQAETCIYPAGSLGDSENSFSATATELRIYTMTPIADCEVIKTYEKQ